MLVRAAAIGPTDLLTRRAPAGGISWDAETRTIDAVVSTFAEVRRFSYVERLSRTVEDWDLTRIGSPAGVPFLSSHDTYSPGAKLGRVLSMTVGRDAVRAKVKLGDSDPAEQLVRDLQAGVGVAISFGYEVGEWEHTPQRAPDAPEIRTAKKIRVIEISAVSVAADPGAHVRSKERTMDPELETAADEPAVNPLPPAAEQPEYRAFGETEMRAMVQQYGLDNRFFNRHKGKDERAFKSAVLDNLARRSDEHTTFPHVEVGTRASFDDPSIRAAAMGEALYQRIAPRHKLSEPSREFSGLTIPGLARQCLEAGGHTTRGESRAQLVTRALHTTSDFPLVLGNTIGRSLREGYDAPESGIRMVARQTTAPDFRAKHRLQLSEGPGLEKVNESGEFKHGSFNEAGESYKVDTFGKIFDISRQALINDDLNAFDRVPRAMGQAALAFEGKFLADLVAANPQMSDGFAMLHPNHNNLAGSGAAPDITTLSAARLALRKQTGLQGELISVPPKYLLVPPDMETLGEQLLASLSATKTDDVNPFPGKLELVVEPRFSDAVRWYVVADPGVIDGLEYAYLEGEQGPQIETRAGFEVDGVQVRVRLDFGAGFVDWRGWFANPGQ